MKNIWTYISLILLFSISSADLLAYSETDCTAEEECVEDASGILPMAAVHIPNRGTYLFRGGLYYKYEYINKERRLLAGYPKKLPGGWKGLPESFLSGIDAAVYYPPTQKTYFFKGNQYVRLTGITVDEDFPKNLPGGWKNLPAEYCKNIDAAMYYPGEEGKKGHIILVKGNKYVSFSNFKIKIVDGNLKDIWGKDLPAPFDQSIQAMALRGTTNDLSSPGTWLFGEQSYMSAPGLVIAEHPDALRMVGVDPPSSKPKNEPAQTNSGGIVFNKSQKPTIFSAVWGSVRDILDWNVKRHNLKLPDRTKITADASVFIPEMGTYIFAGNQYYKYTVDLAKKKKPKLWKNYPQKLPGGWQGLPKSFRSGIDAAFYYPPTKKTYMFKGGQYIRISGRKVEADYPVNLPGGWDGLPKSFYTDIDAAFMLSGGGKPYVVLIKNKSFVVFSNWKKVYSGHIKNLWKDLPRGFNKEINAIAHGGFLGNYLFSGEQVLFAPSHVAEIKPSFHVNTGEFLFDEPAPVDDWQLAVRKRPKKTSATGYQDDIKVSVLSPSDKSKSTKPKPIEEYNEEDGNYDCAVKHIDEKLVSPENILLDPTTDVIWPGAIVDGTSIPNGKYQLLSFPRGNFKIYTKAVANKQRATITQPLDAGHVSEQVNSILTSMKKIPTGTLSFLKHEMYSEKHFRFKLGGSYSAGVASVSAELDLKRSSKKHRLVCDFVQKCFSVDMVDIGHYEDWISDPSKVDFYETLPMYVSSVQYGRRAYLSIESDESVESIQSFLDATYGPASGRLDADQKKFLSNCTVKVYIQGGDGKNAAKAATGDYQAFMNYIGTEPKSASDLVPLSYKMRFLKDKSVANVKLSSKYTVRTCTPYQLRWKATLNFIRVNSADDGDTFDHDEKIYGWAGIFFHDKNGKMKKGYDKMWNLSCGRSVEINEGATHAVNKGEKFEYALSGVKKKKGEKGQGAFIKIGGFLKEEDGCDSDDDTLGYNGTKVYLNDVLAEGGIKQVTLNGFRDGGSDVSMIWTIETY